MRISVRPAAYFLLCLFGVALTIAAYYHGLSGDYIFDDFPNILQNSQLQIHHLTWRSLMSASFSSDSGLLQRPISMLSFALNYYFFGIKPFSFKVVNLLIHIINGLGLYVLGLQLLFVYKKIHRPDLPDQTLQWTAFAASLAWLLHPINLTAVLYVAQRMTSLATLFVIAGLSFFVWGRWRLWIGKRGLGLMLAGLFGFGSLALLSKESGALLPLFMLVIEFALFRFRSSSGKLDKTVISFFLLFLILPAIGCTVWLVMEPQKFLGGYAFRTFTMGQRLLTEPRVIAFYLRLICAPSLKQLGLYHDDIAVSRGLLQPITTLPSILLVIALFGAAFFWRRRWPLLTLGILWFFAGQAMESTILPLEIAFEHRNYLGDFGILLPACYLLLNSSFAPATIIVRRAGLIIFIGALFAITYGESEIWSNNAVQAATEARYHPDSPRAVYAAGRIYVNLVLRGQPQYSKDASDYLERAAEIDKTGIMPDVGLIFLVSKIHEPVKQAWIEDIEQKLRSQPISPSTITSLKELESCLEAGCQISNAQMTAILKSAFQNPMIYRTVQPYADAVTIYGSFLINRLQDFKDGEVAFERAVKISPAEVQYRINLINLLIVMRRYDEARAQLKILIAGNSLLEFHSKIESLKKELASLPKEDSGPG